MIATRIAHPAAAPAEQPARRGVIGFLLLAGIEHTDARPWIGFAGMAACWVLCVLLGDAP